MPIDMDPGIGDIICWLVCGIIGVLAADMDMLAIPDVGGKAFWLKRPTPDWFG